MKCIKIISLILMIILIMNSSISMAGTGLNMSTILSEASNFKNSADSYAESYETSISDFIKSFAGILFGIAIIVLIIWGLFIGIGLMSGSAVSQANVKEALMPYVIGCVVVFGGWAIWATFVVLFEDI